MLRDRGCPAAPRRHFSARQSLRQGLGLALRDASILTEQLLANETWGTDVFDTYAAERGERMRRLRFANAVSTIFDQIGTPTADRVPKLERINALIAAEPALGRVRTILARGPENVPADVFEPATLVALATA